MTRFSDQPKASRTASRRELGSPDDANMRSRANSTTHPAGGAGTAKRTSARAFLPSAADRTIRIESDPLLLREPSSSIHASAWALRVTVVSWQGTVSAA